MSKKARRAGRGSTPATLELERAGIAFHTYEYEHSADHMDDGYGIEAARLLGIPEERVYKTLMADVGDEMVIGIVPVSGHLDLKALAAVVGAKKAAMADPKVAQRESGYVLGGISPLGQRTRMRAGRGGDAVGCDGVLVSGGKRGFGVGLAPKVVGAVLGAVTAPIRTR